MVKDFMCDVVPEANHSCQKLQLGQTTLPKVNPSVNLDHDILAVYAFEEGYVRRGISRKETTAAVADYVKRTGKEISRKCKEEVSAKIYEWLLDSEKTMFSESWTATMLNDMNESFSAFVQKGKLCDVDVVETLKDQEWSEFFGSL